MDEILSLFLVLLEIFLDIKLRWWSDSVNLWNFGTLVFFLMVFGFKNVFVLLLQLKTNKNPPFWFLVWLILWLNLLRLFLFLVLVILDLCAVFLNKRLLKLLHHFLGLLVLAWWTVTLRQVLSLSLRDTNLLIRGFDFLLLRISKGVDLRIRFVFIVLFFNQVLLLILLSFRLSLPDRLDLLRILLHFDLFVVLQDHEITIFIGLLLIIFSYFFIFAFLKLDCQKPIML